MSKIRVYVSGPMTTGVLAENISNAIDTANKILNHGYAPFLPHLVHYWDLKHTHRYGTWLDYDLVWVEACDVLYRMPGKSHGADVEVKKAKDELIPVVYSIQELDRLFKEDKD